MRKYVLLLSCFLFSALLINAQVKKAPDRKEGEGPWTQLIIRGVILIDGTGAPAIGPVDIVIEKNRIRNIVNVGAPGIAINTSRRPVLAAGGKELNCEGMYVMPGFVDMHGHIGGEAQGADAEYVFKLWMAHGVTTVRDPGSMNGLDWVLEEKKKSEQNLITAPRLKAYTVVGQGSKEPIATPEQAIAWVRDNQKKGSDGIKFFGAAPEIMKAAIEENKKIGLRSICE